MDKADRIVVTACILAAAAFVVSEVRAADVHVQLHGTSYHLDRDLYDWNERNLGGGLRVQFNPDWGVQAGTFRNSYNRVTKYAVVQYTPFQIMGRVWAGSVATPRATTRGCLWWVGPWPPRRSPRV